ncbi:MAG: RNA-binding protein [Spirochaetes bacterium]|nr:RNA-binding protein [Spirochaetota bacterium]
MNELKYTFAPAPHFIVLGKLEKYGKLGIDYTLMLLPFGELKFYMLFKEKGRKLLSFANITEESAIELLMEHPFQKTIRGQELFINSQPLEPAKEQIDLSELGVKK